MAGGRRARALFAGLVAGFAGGLFGVGGGILLVPLLTAYLGLTQHQAHGTSLAAIGATAVAGLVVYALHGHVAWLWAVTMALSSVLSAPWGARLAARTGRVGLARAFAIFLLLVAARLLWSTPVGSALSLTGLAGVGAALALGVVIGLVSGFLGVGGGIIAVPALVLLFGAQQQTAQGTSLAIVLATAPVGALEHDRLGNVSRPLLPMLLLGGLIGAPLAAQLAQHLPQQALSRGFAVFLVANAVNTWVRAGRSERSSTASRV